MKLSTAKLMAGGTAIAALAYFLGRHRGYVLGGKVGFALGMDAGEVLWSTYVMKKYGDEMFYEMIQAVGDFEDGLQNDPDKYELARTFMYSVVTEMSPEKWNDLSISEKISASTKRINFLIRLHCQQLWHCMF